MNYWNSLNPFVPKDDENAIKVFSACFGKLQANHATLTSTTLRRLAFLFTHIKTTHHVIRLSVPDVDGMEKEVFLAVKDPATLSNMESAVRDLIAAVTDQTFQVPFMTGQVSLLYCSGDFVMAADSPDDVLSISKDFLTGIDGDKVRIQVVEVAAVPDVEMQKHVLSSVKLQSMIHQFLSLYIGDPAHCPQTTTTRVRQSFDDLLTQLVADSSKIDGNLYSHVAGSKGLQPFAEQLAALYQQLKKQPYAIRNVKNMDELSAFLQKIPGFHYKALQQSQVLAAQAPPRRENGSFSYMYGEYPYNVGSFEPLSTPSKSTHRLRKMTADTIAESILKNSNHLNVLERMLSSNEQFLNVVRFCEQHDNVVEIELMTEESTSTDFLFYKGHHVFAVSPEIDLEKALTGKYQYNGTERVVFLKNYVTRGESRLIDFVNKMDRLKLAAEPIIIKNIRYEAQTEGQACPFSYDACKHLSFIRQLRDYCGDVSGFEPSQVRVTSRAQLLLAINKFHAKYVLGDEPPSPQTVWQLLGQLKAGWDFVKTDLNSTKQWDWSRVNQWKHFEKTAVESVVMAAEPEKEEETEVRAFQRYLQSRYTDGEIKKLAPSHAVPSDDEQSAVQLVKAQIKFFEDQAKRVAHSEWTTALIQAVKKLAPKTEFELTADPTRFEEELEQALAHCQQFARVQTTNLGLSDDKLKEQTKTTNLWSEFTRDTGQNVDISVVFAAHELIYNTVLMEALNKSSEKTLTQLKFLFLSMRENYVVASVSLPYPNNVKKRLLVVAHDVVRTDNLTKEFMSLIKLQQVSLNFLEAQFMVLFEDRILTETVPVNSIELVKMIKDIVAAGGVDVDRIDGVVHETAAIKTEGWTEGSLAATKLALLIQLFLSKFNYPVEDTSASTKSPEELITAIISQLTQLRGRQGENGREESIEQQTRAISPLLAQLAAQIESISKLKMPEIIALLLHPIQQLNALLASF